MKKTRKAHLWIGLICSIFILMESITGLIMNEPWLIGQAETEQRGNFQQGQMGMMPGQQQGTTTDSSQTSGQTGGQTGNQAAANGQTSGNIQSSQNGQSSQNSSNTNGQFQGQRGLGGPGGEGSSQGSFMSVIKGLHEGRIGTTDVKWLIDLTAIAMIFLTGSGIFLSLRVLGADRKRKNAKKAREAA